MRVSSCCRLLFQRFFGRRQELSRFLRVGRRHAVDHQGITVGEARHRPKAFVGLGKEGEAAKRLKELLQGLKFLRFNRATVVVVLNIPQFRFIMVYKTFENRGREPMIFG
jgi:hypothetical protein